MRLLTTAPTAIPHLRDFIGSHIPPYAILSHTWGDDEVTLQQLAAADLFALQGRARFDKVQRACALARTRDSLEYAWVDTCCIDKTSSAELSEAINSMFAWYRDAEVCYVYLSDLEPGKKGDLERDLPGCRWFTRGWTLQELVAPRKVLFFDRGWNYRGSKEGLAPLLSGITSIPVIVLRNGAELGDFAVARRMSWAANRETTRLEDMAYCLLGIFDVNLSLIYGEGIKAFARLQAAILQTTPDLSIFAWVDKSETCSEYAGILAASPALFAECREMEAPVDNSAYANFTMTTRGIQTEASLVPVTFRGGTPAIVALDTRCRMGGLGVGVHVRKIGASLYVRSRPHMLFRGGVDEGDFHELSSLVELLTLATKLPVRLTISRGIDLVAKNRCSAFRLEWGPFVGQEVQRMPRSHFDTEDGVFFSCDPGTEGWCAYVTNGTLPGGSIPGLVSEGVYLKLFFACFQWNRGPAIVVLTSLNSVDAGTGRLLESFLVSQLDQTRFEACQRAKNLVTGIFGDSLVDMGDVRTGSRSVRLYQGSGAWAGMPSNIRVELNIREDIGFDVCIGPSLVCDVSFAVDAVPAQVSRWRR